MNFLDIWKKIRKKEPSDLDKLKNKKNHTFWQENQCPEKKVKRKCACCLAQNLFYNWCLFYTNISYEISIEM